MNDTVTKLLEQRAKAVKLIQDKDESLTTLQQQRASMQSCVDLIDKLVEHFNTEPPKQCD